MATKKQAVNAELEKAFLEAKPANPALSAADKNYLKGLKRRGFTEQEIAEIAKSAGFRVPDDLFLVKTKKAKTAPTQAAPFLA